MDIIKDNPFRILGVYSNASAKDIAANTHRISAYQRVNRDVSFPLDLTKILGKCNRTVESVADAQAKINLPQDKIKYALFWFVNGGAADGIAIGHLEAGNIDKAKEIFRRGRTFSFRLNLGILSLIQKDYGAGVQLIMSVIENDSDRDNFAKSVCGDTFTIDRSTLSSMFIDEMLHFVDSERLLGVFNAANPHSETSSYLRKKVAGQYIDKIESELAAAQSVNSKDSAASYNAGVRLMNNTKLPLQKLRSILGISDLQYTRIADKLANQILQCGINYFNNTLESKATSINKATTLQQYAGQIAVGQRAKDRCKKNLAILDNMREEAKIETDLNYIAGELKYIPTIQEAINVVKRCKPHLMSIKNVLGSNNETYLNISNAIANRVIAVSIDKINADQQRLTNARGQYAYSFVSAFVSVLESTKTDIEESLRLFNNVQEMDMSSSVRQHVNSNRATLIDLRNTINSVYNSLVSPATSGGYGGSSGGNSGGSGCMVVIVALIILGCLGSLLI